MYVIFTAKCFPHKLKQLHTSRFHGAFSLDEISLKPVSLRHLFFVSKVNFQVCTHLVLHEVVRRYIHHIHHTFGTFIFIYIIYFIFITQFSKNNLIFSFIEIIVIFDGRFTSERSLVRHAILFFVKDKKLMHGLGQPSLSQSKALAETLFFVALIPS